eukprot:PITA_03451
MATARISIIISILVLLIAGASNSYSYPVSVQATSAYSPADGWNCVLASGDALGALSPCYDFIINGEISNATPQCCSALNTTVYTYDMCLCFIFADAMEIYGDLINQSQAFLLPDLCKVPVPSVEICATRYQADVPNAPIHHFIPDQSDVPKARISDPSSVHNDLANRNQGLSPPKIRGSAPQSVNSKAIGETINVHG